VPVPLASIEEFQRIRETMSREPNFWLGRTTAREMSRLLLLLLLLQERAASAASTDEMIEVLGGQVYTSRLPRFIAERPGVGVAHKAGDFPPFVLNDVGIIFHPGGPTVISVFVNDNKSGVLAAEETIGRIAEDLVTAWSQ
jgi:hypothetical protein